MATVTQLRDRIKVRLARRTDAGINTVIVDEMTHAQVEILEAEKWLPHFLKTVKGVSFSGAHDSIGLGTLETGQSTLPTGFIRLLEPNQEQPSLEYFDGTRWIGFPRFDSFVQLRQIHGDGSPPGTVPGGYFWDGNPEGVLRLRPILAGAVSYNVWYYRHDPNTPTSPATGDVTLWTKHAGDYLMHTAGVEVATYLRDKTALDYFVSKRQEAYNRLVGQKTATDQGDTEFVMGDD